MISYSEEKGKMQKEINPNPKDVNAQKKPPLHLIPSPPQLIIARAHLDGSIKYGAYNWRETNVNASVYVSAALRHINDWYNGVDIASDSHIHNLAHAAACINILLDAEICGTLVDDRPTWGGDIDKLNAEYLEWVQWKTKTS